MATSETLKSALNRANPNTLADVLAKIDLGTMLEMVQQHQLYVRGRKI